jgi:hypothetical protein
LVWLAGVATLPGRIINTPRRISPSRFAKVNYPFPRTFDRCSLPRLTHVDGFSPALLLEIPANVVCLTYRLSPAFYQPRKENPTWNDHIEVRANSAPNHLNLAGS